MAMTERFCPTCNAEVVDAGGFCLLGHPLRLAHETASLSELRSEQENASLSELRAEVDDAFDKARSEVAELLAATAAIGPAPVAGPALTNGTPPPRVAPPPPPPPRSVPQTPTTPAQPNGSDPISAFSPPPRMDWGPTERHSRFKRRHPRSEG